MAETDIGSTTATNITDALEAFGISTEVTDGAGDSNETTYQNQYWSEDYGHYLNVPEFKVAVDAKATWTMGAGYEADPFTQIYLSLISGNGKDTFNTILKNMIKIKTITGDAFAEIIRDDNGVMVNLKPLDPSSIRVVQSKKGRIKRYEQVTKTDGKESKHVIKTENMFHLSHDRMADEIKGTRIIKSLKWLIEARNEAMADWRTVLRRNVKPMRIWYVDSDDTAEIAAFKNTVDGAYGSTENLVVPKGTVESEIASVAPNQTLNPMQWINQLNDYFFQAVMVPQIIIGQGKEFTDASGKIVYLSYEQSVKAEQLYIEEQVLTQLNVEIELTFPASLQNELLTSKDQDPNLQAAQPNDTTAELEGRT